MKKRNWYLLIVFLTLIFILRLATLSRPHFLSGTKMKITAALAEEPKIIGQTQAFSLLGIKIKTWKYPQYHYGDRLVVMGTIKENTLEFPGVELSKSESKKGLFFWISNLRRKIEEVYRKSLPEPQASLLSGIVLGSKAGIPGDFYKSLQKTGTLHAVVASGMNVTIIASTLLPFFLWFCSRRLAVVLVFFGIWFYVLLSGAEIPIVRAGIMGTLVFLAQGLGKEVDAWRGLGLAAVILLLINPLSLFDLGFQLSFAATGGILFFGPKISKFLKRLPKQIQPDITQTLAAQIAVLPLLLFNFGQYSPWSVPANLLVVTILSLVMKLGAVIAIAGLIFLPLGQIAAWLAWPLLTYFVRVVELFGGL